MPDFVGGLPLHPLVVHFVVVLLPIAVLGSILTAIWPAVRRRYGWLAVAAAGVGTALTPIATDSGEFLESRIGTNPDIQRHAALGDLLPWWALGLFVAVTALMILHRRAEKADKVAKAGAENAAGESETTTGGAVATETKRTTGASVALIVAAVVTIGLAVGTGIHTYRVGDAGARMVWEFVEQTPPANGG